MEIIIEVLARHGRVRERYKFSGEQIQIGRAYQNDVIIADPYVCPHHLQLQFDAGEGQWKVLDQSTRNGSFLVGRGRLQHSHIVQSGDEFDLGETRIRLILPHHEVAPTRMLPNGRMLADYLSSPLTATALLVSTLGLFAFVQYLGMAKEAKLQELLLEGLMFLAVPFIWACIWGLIGRVAVHDARFSFHLSIGSLMLVLVFVLSYATEYVGFGFSNDGLVMWIDSVLEGVLLAGFLLAGLRMATRMQRLGRWILANTLAWSLVGIAVLAYTVKSDPYETQAQMGFFLKPPLAQWQTADSLDDFMQRVDGTFHQLNQYDE
ncbi:MAG: FHA domain-containing protein [Gammaproteobacteria bacterium]